MKHRMIIWSVNPETESRSVIDILEGMLFRKDGTFKAWVMENIHHGIEMKHLFSIEIVPEDRT